MHGLRDLGGKGDTPARAAQAERLAALAASIRAEGDATVVCGDFNVRPGSDTHAILRDRLGVADLVTGRGFDGTRTSHYPKAERFADYMMVDDAVPVAAFDVVRTPEVSDHCPLVLEIG